MENSILNTIKKMLGLDADYDAFDTDVKVLINSALMTLQQLGVVPKEGYKITNAENTWAEFLDSEKMLEGVKEYIYLKVKLIFDPPGTSYVVDAYKNQITELEWRLKEQMEVYPGSIEPEEETDNKYYEDDIWGDG